MFNLSCFHFPRDYFILFLAIECPFHCVTSIQGADLHITHQQFDTTSDVSRCISLYVKEGSCDLLEQMIRDCLIGKGFRNIFLHGNNDRIILTLN